MKSVMAVMVSAAALVAGAGWTACSAAPPARLEARAQPDPEVSPQIRAFQVRARAGLSPAQLAWALEEAAAMEDPDPAKVAADAHARFGLHEPELSYSVFETMMEYQRLLNREERAIRAQERDDERSQQAYRAAQFDISRTKTRELREEADRRRYSALRAAGAIGPEVTFEAWLASDGTATGNQADFSPAAGPVSRPARPRTSGAVRSGQVVRLRLEVLQDRQRRVSAILTALSRPG